MAKAKSERIDVIVFGPHVRVDGTLEVPSAARFQEFLKNNCESLPVFDAEFLNLETKDPIHSAALAYLNLNNFHSVVPRKAAKLKKTATADNGSLTLRSIMSTKVISVKETDTIHHAFQVMKNNDIHHLPVVQNRVMTGLLSKGDVRMHLFNQHDDAVRKIMRKKIVVAAPDDTLADAVRNMSHHQVTCFPILENKRLVGIVTNRDVLKVLAEKVL